MAIIIASTHLLGGPGGATSTAVVRGIDTSRTPASLATMTELRAHGAVMSRTSIKVQPGAGGVAAIEDAIRASGLLDVASVPAPDGPTSIDLGDATRNGALAVRIDDRLWTSQATPDAVTAMRAVIDAMDGQRGPVQS